ncbi:MAG: hypothetical protein Q4E33_03965 [Erysipelotrichaceae bacterium]|nr:hypothetical protein [Erysipelotrichaceae bacterium]
MKKIITILLVSVLIINSSITTIFSEEADDSVDDLLSSLNNNIYDIDELNNNINECLELSQTSNDKTYVINRHYYDSLALATSINPREWSNYDFIWLYSDDSHRVGKQLGGQSSTWPVYIIDKLAYRQFTGYFTCIATNKEDSSQIKTKYEVNVTRDEKKDYDYILFLGINSIDKGQTMDLDSLGIGSGKISLNDDGSVIDLDNVDYEFDPDKLYGDMRFMPATCLNYYQIGNKNQNVTINVIGNNTFKNDYYTENSEQNGYAYNIAASYIGDISRMKRVNYEIVGDGILNTIGGAGGIWLRGDAYFNTNLTYTGTAGQKTYGIYTCKTTFGPKANILMNEVSRGIHPVNGYMAGKEGENDVIFEKGSKIELNVTSYLTTGPQPVMSYGILTSGNITIDGAILDINLYSDQDIYAETNIDAYGCSGISITNKAHTKNMSIINGSIVDISYDNNYDVDDKTLMLTRAYGLYDSYPYINDKGLSKITIEDSKVNIDFKGKVSEINAIITKQLDIINSDVDIDIDCYTDNNEELIGIKIERNVDYDKPQNLYIEDSNVDIDIDTKNEIEKEKAGIVADYLEVNINDEDYKLDIDTNGGKAFLSQIGAGDIERTYEEGYEIQKIKLSGNAGLPNKENINVYSNTKNIGSKLFDKDYDYYYFETLYSDSKKPTSKILITHDSYKPEPEPTPTPKPTPSPVPYVAPKTGIN